MDFGLTGKAGGYYLAERYQKSVTGKSEGVSFAELAVAKMARQENVLGMSFEEMMKGKYPEMKIHQKVSICIREKVSSCAPLLYRKK